MDHAAYTAPIWHGVTIVGVLALLVLSLIVVAAVVVTEHRRAKARREDPLGIARTLDEYRDREAQR